MGPLGQGQRWTATRKREVVLRIFRGEPMELLSREMDIHRLIGLEHCYDPERSLKESHDLLATRLKELDREIKEMGKLFPKNVERLSRLLGLSDAEKKILLFSLLISEEPAMQSVLDNLESGGIKNFYDDLTWILQLNRAAVVKAFASDSPLIASGIIELDRRAQLNLQHRLELLHGLGSLLLDSHGALEKLLQQYFSRGPAPQLSKEHFPHLGADLDISLNYLGAALKRRLSGVNLLLYGPPGTGKTELARLMASCLGVSLYEINVAEDVDSFREPGKKRFRSFLLSQRFLCRAPRSLILFDEIEDVFPVIAHLFPGMQAGSGNLKAWTNRLLETNPVPAIWVSNAVAQIDPAFIRRFDLVLEVPVPPRSVRKQMFYGILEDLPVTEDLINGLADNDSLAPALVTQAAKVANLTGESDSERLAGLVNRVIAGTQKAMGIRAAREPVRHSCQNYALEYVNAGCDLEELIRACRDHRRGKICLYGPPGSGKTQFVYYLAHRMEMPVLAKRASDILDMFVGQTEKRIAAMFQEALDGGALLLLDEADSFLQDRGRAHHSWEVTQVNELLVQMETYHGLFFCATNLMDVIDSAVFRRFDVKIRFDYLHLDQAWGLFRDILQDRMPPEELILFKSRLGRMNRLTPGDFATVRNRCRLLGKELDALTLLQGLEQECAAKPGAPGARVGFTI
ncbi:MAG: AAA family ATPase [Deltaproteobacteria bacterium]|nr:AAA family ATPase [Deltaproteobacteria bacterium]